jgi:hypothetical protein
MPDKRQQAKKLGLSGAPKMIRTPVNPDRSSGNTAKNAVLNLSHI